MSLVATRARALEVMASRRFQKPGLIGASVYVPADGARAVVTGQVLRHLCDPRTGQDRGIVPDPISLGDFHKKWLPVFADRLSVVEENRFGVRYEVKS